MAAVEVGLVGPKRVKSNTAAQAGDVLILEVLL